MDAELTRDKPASCGAGAARDRRPGVSPHRTVRAPKLQEDRMRLPAQRPCKNAPGTNQDFILG
ncbi:hypothetical protein GCM10014715_06460 [Streptomyces spiralis]|uniref:Uncharacterized protein n=1 Tax=Streptomyces spiralis TaxID=66376 RepID=A0A918ZJG1_9ACTN|nr:hypothetical protein [Streptomyces spiralis]GHE56202.1 hypothetical protein GCM10014715_06460 [Streptomyces spiralis]